MTAYSLLVTIPGQIEHGKMTKYRDDKGGSPRSILTTTFHMARKRRNESHWSRVVQGPGDNFGYPRGTKKVSDYGSRAPPLHRLVALGINGRTTACVWNVERKGWDTVIYHPSASSEEMNATVRHTPTSVMAASPKSVDLYQMLMFDPVTRTEWILGNRCGTNEWTA